MSCEIIYAEGSLYIANKRSGEVRMYFSKKYWEKLRRYANKHAKVFMVVENGLTCPR